MRTSLAETDHGGVTARKPPGGALETWGRQRIRPAAARRGGGRPAARGRAGLAGTADGGVPGRKPPGVSFETWVEQRIRSAEERGEFSGLRGAGRPLPAFDPDEPAHDWAVAQGR